MPGSNPSRLDAARVAGGVFVVSILGLLGGLGYRLIDPHPGLAWGDTVSGFLLVGLFSLPVLRDWRFVGHCLSKPWTRPNPEPNPSRLFEVGLFGLVAVSVAFMLKGESAEADDVRLVS